MYITQPFWFRVVYYGRPLCIFSVSTLSGVKLSSSYVTMGVGFEFCLSIGAGAFSLLGIFTLRDVVVLVEFLCFASTIFYDVSLWGVSCVVLFIILFTTPGKDPRN